jgi:Mg2+-importing ATPase
LVNPLNALLLSLATVSVFLGDRRAAAMIVVMVMLSVGLGFVQEHRSNRAGDALRRIVRTTATVRRANGETHADHVEVPIEEIVPGDIVLISAGDMIPADLRLISPKVLFVIQPVLTGESMPIEKVAQADTDTAQTSFDPRGPKGESSRSTVRHTCLSR